MAFMGNSMFYGEMQPRNFAAPVGAKQVSNPRQQSDSFLGSPLAVGANSPPAGPIAQSVQMAGAKEGYENATTLGKILSITVALGVGSVILPKEKSAMNYVGSLGAGIGTFYALNYMFDKLR
jgi:hypothetical protein